MAGGRPSKSAEWLTKDSLTIIRSWRRAGLTEQQIAENIGVHISTLCEWKKRFSEFSEALKGGKAEANAIVENALFNAAIGTAETTEETTELRGGDYVVTKSVVKRQPPNVSAAIFYLKNRAGWKDNPTDKDDTNNEIKITLDWKRD